MKIKDSECQLVEKFNCPDSFDFIKTLKEFHVKFVDYEDDKESFDNDSDTAVVLCPKEINSWKFFQAVYALKPDSFMFAETPAGTVACLMWDEIEE